MVDLTVAVEAGVVLAAFLFLRRMAEVADIRPGGKSPGAEILYGHPEEGGAFPLHAKNIDVYEITGPFFFGVADILQRVLREIRKKPLAFVLRMREVPAIDSTGISALESFLSQCRKSGIKLILSEVREQPLKALKKAGFISELGEANFSATLENAIQCAGEAESSPP
jgi:SulP family sulfate permease